MTAQPNLDPRGLKRICSNCSNRFYDMNKRPIVCPVCSTEFEGVKIKTRRSSKATDEKAASQVSKATANDDEDEDLNDDDVMSLEDAADLEENDDEDDEAMDLDDDLGDLDDLDDDMDDDDMDDLDADIRVSKDDD